ncbi:protease modulator HflC [Reinekea marinisedimentorum]|uniref:Protein HflC n=1 Tax=Reinekea marinisedimentorum TaxID=230495 RepID=A0A4R3I9C1_9GAMM|nr:protease modulator HflC [Reinekea marinisedimentorum]TCS42988.1 membrane protease subunit HflC [Reinekea marinisedimentorum]
MNFKSSALIALLAVLIVAGYVSLYTVKETESAIKLKFGEVVTTDIEPGLHFKIPVVHDIKKFDIRVITLDSQPERFITSEQKSLEVDSYVQWRIADTLKFYTANSGGDFFSANQVLGSRVNAALRDAFGDKSLREVVTGLKNDQKLPATNIIGSADDGERDALMEEVLIKVNRVAHEELGIEVLDIRVKAIDLPEQVSDDVFRRMRSEREQLARSFRSEGQRQAEIISANADQERTITLANAYREAEKIRGEGDAEAAKIYADAYSKDADFYAFYRSLQAYRTSFGDSGDLMVLEPDSDFFRFLKDQTGKQ